MNALFRNRSGVAPAIRSVLSRHKTVVGSLLTAGLVGCSAAPATPWQQAAVTAYLKQTLAVPDSYQPLRWGTPVAWRRHQLAAADLPLARRRLQAVAAELAHDSAGYALVAQTAAQFGTAAADVALVQQRYLTGVRYRDSVRADFRELVAAQRDTTLAFYRLAHTYRFQNAQGQAQVDSAAFNVGQQGQVVPLHVDGVSPPTAPADSASPPPPPPPDLKSIRYY